jgi:exodeoxyribonuclease-5
MKELTLSRDQQAAWEKLSAWAAAPPLTHPYFVLRGYAGTGKTYLMQLLTTLDFVTLLFSAPTNKATKVLGRAVGQAASTTYSTLGLRMVEEDDHLVMSFGDKMPYLPAGSILIVDEASMVATELAKFIDKARLHNSCKVLYVGDPAQLPPVGEDTSPCWQITKDPKCRAFLKEVMRYDNQLLAAATRIRDSLLEEDWSSPLMDDYDTEGGVHLSSEKSFRKRLNSLTTPGEFESTKLIAWRNRTVNAYNEGIRANFGFRSRFCVGDRLLLAEPLKQEGLTLGHIDDEVSVQNVAESTKTVLGITLPVYYLEASGDLELELSIPKDASALASVLSDRARQARDASGFARKRLWNEFWQIKEAFNSVRYGYCLTAHRAQGSTYTSTFVDQKDILCNSDKETAFRCLYVACTRATEAIYTY